MRAVIQRVSEAKVTVGQKVLARIGQGLVVLLGVAETDADGDARYVTNKIANLRIFSDAQGKFDASVKDIDGEVLVVSQFTLLADVKKGRRPSFTGAARPEKAQIYYESVLKGLREAGIVVREGQFQAKMDVCLVNDGPVTIMLDSKANR